ncbi:MAG: response regulator transcription factor [Ruminococcus sp.]|nr:response regulator transcription factor [Ruminococcus sp.]
MADKSTVLVVEDDIKLRTTVMDYLSSNGFEVLSAEDGLKAINLFEEHRSEIDIILLDGMLPMLDGLEVLKHIREESDVPVIMISARETEMDQLQGFYMGADNYITKPFLLSVLREQISALLSRTQKSEKLIGSGALKIDTRLHRVYIDGKEISTTPKEYDLLLFFITNEKIVLNRDTILDRVWGIDYYGDFRTVDTIIKQLRKKLTDKHKYIKSVYGVGYYFEANDD